MRLKLIFKALRCYMPVHNVRNLHERNTCSWKTPAKARHLNMIAIGGSIGTGLFLDQPLQTQALVGLYSLTLYYDLLLNDQFRWACDSYPGAFFTYGSRYVEDGFGFAGIIGTTGQLRLHLNLLLYYEILVSRYSRFLLECPFIIFMINAMSVKGFGESESQWLKLLQLLPLLSLVLP